MKRYTTVTKDFSYRGENYSIVFDGKFYMTVNHKFIGQDGKLTKTLNYTDGLHPSDSIEECINETMIDLDFNYYVNQGMGKAEAFSKATNMPLALAKEIYN